jgi:hypothetical protein
MTRWMYDCSQLGDFQVRFGVPKSPMHAVDFMMRYNLREVYQGDKAVTVL